MSVPPADLLDAVPLSAAPHTGAVPSHQPVGAGEPLVGPVPIAAATGSVALVSTVPYLDGPPRCFDLKADGTPCKARPANGQDACIGHQRARAKRSAQLSNEE